MRNSGRRFWPAARLGMALVGAWLMAVFIGSACYAAQARSDPDFFLAFAVATAATAAVAWAVGGQRKRALAFLIGLAALGFGLISLALVVFWGFGDHARIWFGASRPVYVEFWGDLWGISPARHYQAPGSPIRYRLIGHGEMLRTWLAKLGRDALGLGAVASLPAGLISGGMMLLARRRPRLAGACSLGLILAVGTLIPALMSTSTDLILDWRTEGGTWNATSMTDGELATMLGAIMGSVVGAILIGLDTRLVLGTFPGPPRSATAQRTN